MNLDSQSDLFFMPRKSAAVRRKAADPAAPSKSRARVGVAAARGTKAARLRDDFRSFARAAILSAAEEVLAHEGLHAARIEEIAQRARVAVGTIYNLVGDREALVREILLARHAEIVAMLAATLKTHKDRPFRDQVHGFLLSVFTYFGQHWQFFRLVMESERAAPAAGSGKLGQAKRASHDMHLEIRKLYRELVQRGIKQGTLRANGSELYPAMLSGMLREVIFQDLESQTLASPEGRADELTRMFLEGAGKR